MFLCSLLHPPSCILFAGISLKVYRAGGKGGGGCLLHTPFLFTNDSKTFSINDLCSIIKKPTISAFPDSPDYTYLSLLVHSDHGKHLCRRPELGRDNYKSYLTATTNKTIPSSFVGSRPV